MSHPHIAVIIPTLNREERLVQTLTSLFTCSYPKEKLEIIVVDQTRTHAVETAEFLQNHMHGERKQWLRPPEITFQSLTKARNVGMKAAPDAQIYVFIDDDVEMQPNFLEVHVAAYADNAIGAVAGRITVPGHTYPSENPAVISDMTWFGAFINNFYGTKRQDTRGFVGCNFSLRASAVQKTRGFDEQFVGNAMREDTDMAFRICEAGYRIVFLPEAHVIHHMEAQGGTRSAASRVQWYEAFFTNHFLFYGKHAAAWRMPFFILHLWRPILACWLYYGKGAPKALKAVYTGIRNGLRAAKTSAYSA